MINSFLTPSRVKNYLSVGFSALLIVGVSFFLVLTLTPKGVATTPDSLAYLYAAQNFSHGGSVSIPDFKLITDSYEKPMTAWPPLYPIVLSWIVTDSQPEESVRLFNCIMLSLLGIFFMLNTIKPNFLLGLLSVLVILLQGTVITVYSYAWSETLFLPLLISAYFFVVHYCNYKKRRYLFLALLLIIMASYTRYIGIIFLCPFIAMLWLSNLPRSDKIFSSAVVSITALLAFIPLLVRNITTMGVVGGEAREESSTYLLANVADVGDLLAYHLLGIWSGYYFIFIIIFMATVIGFFEKENIKRGQLSNLTMIIWPLSWFACYVAAIVILRTWKNFDDLDTRLISPAIIFFLLSAIQFVNFVISKHRWRGGAVLLGAWGVWLIIHGIGIYSNALASWRNQTSHAYQMNEHIQYGNFTSHPGTVWMPEIYRAIQQLTENTDPAIIVDGSQSMVFQHLTHAKVKELPAILNQAMIEKINQKGVGALVITTPSGFATMEAYYGKNFNHLSALPDLLKYNVLVVSLPIPTSTTKIEKY